MDRVIAYRYSGSPAGFWIKLTDDGRWLAMFESEPLGSYNSPQAAIEALALGDVPMPTGGSTAQFALSPSIDQWTAASR